ncbi:MAG: leucyl/phenylalanyl-tRNA--protein transferase [Desulfonatronovibrio sp.]
MSTFFLTRAPVFPHPSQADADGLLAIGGDLGVTRLCNAYARGIFPWYGPGSPILWWSPDPRLVLYPERFHIPGSLKRILNSKKFCISCDTVFEKVIEKCAAVPRKGDSGTWIVPEMIDAYIRLHHAGIAHSFEAWQGSHLAGGIYGVALGKAFFGESMYYQVPDASKTALVHLMRHLKNNGFYFMDCQQTTSHMLRFGAVEVARKSFLKQLETAVSQTDKPGKWQYTA